MRKYVVTAAALMLGSSALAWAPAELAKTGGMIEGVKAVAAKSDWSADKSPLAFAAFDDKGAMKSGSTAVESSSTMAKADSVVPAAFAKWEDPTVSSSASASADMADKDDVGTASADMAAKGDVQTASADMSADAKAETQTASWDGKAAEPAAAMGGPIETAEGYPPCDPGPGDDRCIQLYEPGVRQALAAWKGTDSNVAMGGPYEPAATGAKDQSADHQAMGHGSGHSGTGTATGHGSGHSTTGSTMSHGSGHNGHAASDAGKPTATMEGDAAAATGDKPAATGSASGMASPGAVGGPVETRSGYPPCRPGRGDDRCIQLYERGVTGREN